MRTASLVFVAIAAVASNARSDDRPKLAVVHPFTGIDLVETVNEAWHIHGGAPATIATARMNFQLCDGNAHVVITKQLELLHANCNEKQKWADRKPLAVTGYEVYDWDHTE